MTKCLKGDVASLAIPFHSDKEQTTDVSARWPQYLLASRGLVDVCPEGNNMDS